MSWNIFLIVGINKWLKKVNKNVETNNFIQTQQPFTTFMRGWKINNSNVLNKSRNINTNIQILAGIGQDEKFLSTLSGPYTN